MKLKIAVLFLWMFQSMNSQITSEKPFVFIKDTILTSTLKGYWRVSHAKKENLECDCENFDGFYKSKTQNKTTSKKDSLAIHSDFNFNCSQIQKNRLIISDKYLINVFKAGNFVKHDTSKISIDKNLKPNLLYIKNGARSYNIKVELIDENYFKLIYHPEKFWLKFKKVEPKN
ncbi:exported protein of unknown function [Tenacibaculum sp. 190130A14a]|uniref:Lipocalin-like domain-containing protein n=1 Tax=Tenacibaculum polynesiense TaxID=3137857 RepID=A0ABM9P781_9FLAO